MTEQCKSPHTQLCWSCGNYLGGCPWTRVDPDTGRVCFDPVPGWVTVPHPRRVRGVMEIGVMILSCPQYIWDGTTPPPGPRLWTNEVVLSLFREGKSCREVAELTGMSANTASYYRQKFRRKGLLEG